MEELNEAHIYSVQKRGRQRHERAAILAIDRDHHEASITDCIRCPITDSSQATNTMTFECASLGVAAEERNGFRDPRSRVMFQHKRVMRARLECQMSLPFSHQVRWRFLPISEFVGLHRVPTECSGRLLSLSCACCRCRHRNRPSRRVLLSSCQYLDSCLGD